MKILNFSLMVLFALFVFGCTATITMEGDYDIRIVNNSGERIKVSWDGDSIRYIDDGCILTISAVDLGYHELEWEWDSGSPRKHTKSSKVFKFEVNANFEIVIQEDSDGKIVIISSDED